MDFRHTVLAVDRLVLRVQVLLEVHIAVFVVATANRDIRIACCCWLAFCIKPGFVDDLPFVVVDTVGFRCSVRLCNQLALSIQILHQVYIAVLVIAAAYRHIRIAGCCWLAVYIKPCFVHVLLFLVELAADFSRAILRRNRIAFGIEIPLKIDIARIIIAAGQAIVGIAVCRWLSFDVKPRNRGDLLFFIELLPNFRISLCAINRHALRIEVVYPDAVASLVISILNKRISIVSGRKLPLFIAPALHHDMVLVVISADDHRIAAAEANQLFVRSVIALRDDVAVLVVLPAQDRIPTIAKGQLAVGGIDGFHCQVAIFIIHTPLCRETVGSFHALPADIQAFFRRHLILLIEDALKCCVPLRLVHGRAAVHSQICGRDDIMVFIVGIGDTRAALFAQHWLRGRVQVSHGCEIALRGICAHVRHVEIAIGCRLPLRVVPGLVNQLLVAVVEPADRGIALCVGRSLALCVQVLLHHDIAVLVILPANSDISIPIRHCVACRIIPRYQYSLLLLVIDAPDFRIPLRARDHFSVCVVILFGNDITVLVIFTRQQHIGVAVCHCLSFAILPAHTAEKPVFIILAQNRRVTGAEICQFPVGIVIALNQHMAVRVQLFDNLSIAGFDVHQPAICIDVGFPVAFAVLIVVIDNTRVAVIGRRAAAVLVEPDFPDHLLLLVVFPLQAGIALGGCKRFPVQAEIGLLHYVAHAVIGAGEARIPGGNHIGLTFPVIVTDGGGLALFVILRLDHGRRHAECRLPIRREVSLADHTALLVEHLLQRAVAVGAIDQISIEIQIALFNDLLLFVQEALHLRIAVGKHHRLAVRVIVGERVGIVLPVLPPGEGVLLAIREQQLAIHAVIARREQVSFLVVFVFLFGISAFNTDGLALQIEVALGFHLVIQHIGVPHQMVSVGVHHRFAVEIERLFHHQAALVDIAPVADACRVGHRIELAVQADRADTLARLVVTVLDHRIALGADREIIVDVVIALLDQMLVLVIFGRQLIVAVRAVHRLAIRARIIDSGHEVVRVVVPCLGRIAERRHDHPPVLLVVIGHAGLFSRVREADIAPRIAFGRDHGLVIRVQVGLANHTVLAVVHAQHAAVAILHLEGQASLILVGLNDGRVVLRRGAAIPADHLCVAVGAGHRLFQVVVIGLILNQAACRVVCHHAGIAHLGVHHKFVIGPVIAGDSEFIVRACIDKFSRRVAVLVDEGTSVCIRIGFANLDIARAVDALPGRGEDGVDAVGPDEFAIGVQIPHLEESVATVVGENLLREAFRPCHQLAGEVVIGLPLQLAALVGIVLLDEMNAILIFARLALCGIKGSGGNLSAHIRVAHGGVSQIIRVYRLSCDVDKGLRSHVAVCVVLFHSLQLRRGFRVGVGSRGCQQRQ